MWVIAQLVRYLPRVRHETLTKAIETPATNGLPLLLGPERASLYHRTLEDNCSIIMDTTSMKAVPERMLQNLRVLTDSQRDLWAKEASICELERQLKDAARQFYQLREAQEKGSTLALMPTSSGGCYRTWYPLAVLALTDVRCYVYPRPLLRWQ